MDKSRLEDVKASRLQKEDTVDELEEVPDSRRKVLDGGYGWIVVLGCFLGHTITGGIERSDGVFFLQFLQRFGQSAQLTSWPGSIMSTMNLCIGPIASAICNRYSVRSSVMIAGLMMSAGCILNGYATNFYFLFFSHSLLLGIGRGLCYAPGLIIVAMYFEKRRGLATGIGSSGVGAGTFLLVPFSQYLFENFGFRGAFLIFGGIALNIVLVAMLYRPLSTHYRISGNSPNLSVSVDRVDVAEVIFQSEVVSEVGSMISISAASNAGQRKRSQELQSLTSLSGKYEADSNRVPKSPVAEEGCLISSLKICFPTETRADDDDTSKKLCHFYLLKDPCFLLYCLSIWLFTMSMKAGFMFLPALVKFKGNSEYEASLVLSITGAVDCMSRISSGYVLDTKTLRRYRPVLYNLAMVAMAGLAFVLPAMESFESFCIACALYGFFTGTYVSQKSVILVDILGVEHLTSSLGILIFFQSLGTLLGPPISGALRDHFGSFSQAFYLGGGFMLAAGMVMLISNIMMILRRRRRSLRR